MQKKIVLTCALTGAGPFSGNPNQPVTPQQIADSGLAAAEAGAAILHVHVRDLKTKELSGDLELYEETVGLIRKYNSNVILNLTTGLGSGYYPEDPLHPIKAGPESHLWTAEKRVEHVLKLKPEICTFDLVTGQVFGGIVISTEQQLSKMANLIRAAGVMPELELFDTGDLVLAKNLIKKGVLEGPGIYSFVMGLNYAMPADTETMLFIRNMLPAGAQFTGFGIGKNQFPMAIQSAILGGHMRVGMEDNAYIRKGVYAESNAQQVTKAKNLLDEIGGELANSDEARAIMGLSKRA